MATLMGGHRTIIRVPLVPTEGKGESVGVPGGWELCQASAPLQVSSTRGHVGGAPPHSPRNPVPTDDLIQLTAMCWLREFIQLAGRVMLPYSSGILTAVLPCLAYDDRKRSILQPGEQRQGQP